MRHTSLHNTLQNNLNTNIPLRKKLATVTVHRELTVVTVSSRWAHRELTMTIYFIMGCYVELGSNR